MSKQGSLNRIAKYKLSGNTKLLKLEEEYFEANYNDESKVKVSKEETPKKAKK